MTRSALSSSLLLLLLGLSVAGCGGDAVTQIVVVVDTSEYAIPAEIDRLVVTVFAPSGDALIASADLTAADTEPRTVGVLLERGRLDGYAVEVDGRLSASSSIVKQRALVSFVRGETRYLHFTLHASCAGVSCCGVPVSGSCTEVETCLANGTCGPAQTGTDATSSTVSALDEALEVSTPADAGAP